VSAVTFDLDTVPAGDRDRVEAMIPDPALAGAYVHRQISGVSDFELFDYATATKKNIILSGPTGSAKTTAFRAYAAARGLPFALVECNAAMDPGLIVGRTTVAGEGEIAFVPGDLTLVVKYGGVGLLDEINMAHPRVASSFHQLLAVTRRMSIPEAGATYRAGAEGLGETQPTLFGAAYNPRYQGTVRLNEALLNRYAIPLRWGYDPAVEGQLVKSVRLLDMAGSIRGLAEIRTPVSTNALMEFEEHAVELGVELATELFVNRFAEEEQGPVARALEANRDAIMTELSATVVEAEFEAENERLRQQAFEDVT
jgi:MoxR-like ATPase